VTHPYVPYAPGSAARALYTSVAQVLRLTPVLTDGGGMSVSWAPVGDILDAYVSTPGQLACRLDLQFTRPGKDAPMPIVAGRAPDRVGVLFYDMPADSSGLPLLKAGDRLQMIAGPIAGTFELRQVPEQAQDFLGGHHGESQVIEVSQSLQPGSYTPFPGSPG
jgi:hypothetical protein